VSTALGISAVTAVLENLLNSVFVSAGLGSVKVSAVAPDIVQSSLGSGTTTALQVNLFLHQVTPNASWRNADLPSVAADGRTRLKNQPLALDLHYLLTAYASEDCQAEALLGYAVQFLHENPVLARSDIQTNLAGLPSNPSLAGLLGSSGLENQIEMIKITPAILGREEMAWLWTALKADYRLTFPFQVSVVLIQAKNPSQAPLPVASRNLAAQAGLLPSIASVVPPTGQSAACLGDTVTVSGTGLGNAVGIFLSNAYLGIQYPDPQIPDPPIVPSSVTSTSLQFIVPNKPTRVPSGVYLMSVQIQPPGLSTPVSSNSLPLAVAPKIISGLPSSVAGPSFTLNPTCSPVLLAKQQVSLILGSHETLADAAVPPPPPPSTNSPKFTFTNVTSGTYLVRLRVDGMDSPVTYKPVLGPTINVT
jgi:hypothetical protein